MNVQGLIGKKIDQTQGFLEDGTRVPLSIISMGQNIVSQLKTVDHEGYSALQLGFDTNKRPTKPLAGHFKKAGIESTPRFLREIRVDDTADAASGLVVTPQEVFEPGDIVDVTGISKGKGYAGVVKRHGFHGGPKTHGQSDRHRAPGASGQGTTPGRVYRGKRMSGRMGNAQVTVKNLEVLEIKDGAIYVRGLVPGSKGSIVTVIKVGKNKKFMPLWSEARDQSSEVGEPQEATNVKTPQDAIEAPATTENTEEIKAVGEIVQTAEGNAQVEEPENTEDTTTNTENAEEVNQDAK